MSSPHPAPRVVIASNTVDGKSTIASDKSMELFSPFGPTGSAFATFYTSSTPASNTSPLPPSTTSSIPRPPPNGSVFCTSDIAPNSTSAFHRTLTLDYMVVLKGEICLRLDEGEETVLKEGDALVQRGTAHAWVNKTDEWCRLLFVMLDAEKVKLSDGKELEQVFVPNK